MTNGVVGRAAAYRTGNRAGCLRALRFRISCHPEVAAPLVRVVRDNREIEGGDCRASRRDCRQQWEKPARRTQSAESSRCLSWREIRTPASRNGCPARSVNVGDSAMHTGARAPAATLWAFPAVVVELEPVPDDLADLSGHFAEHALDGGVAECPDASAGDADEVSVARRPAHGVARRAVRENGPAEDTEVHEQRQRAVDGRAPQGGCPCDDLLRAEQAGPAGEYGDEFTAREGDAYTAFAEDRQDVRLGLRSRTRRRHVPQGKDSDAPCQCPLRD